MMMLFKFREHRQSMDNNFIILYHQTSAGKAKVGMVTSISTIGGTHASMVSIVSFTMGREELKEHFLGCKWALCSKDFCKMANKGARPSITTFFGMTPHNFLPLFAVNERC
jgi:hypothetical protein